MHNRFRKAHQTPRVTERVRNQIAIEAARRMYDVLVLNPGEVPPRLGDATETEYYSAKRKAAAVLGHTVRPGDLPSDSEVRTQLLIFANARVGLEDVTEEDDEDGDEPTLEKMADHVDRFAIYKMRLEPLEAVKLNPYQHPEGDALYHSLQVFEQARHVRPYDEEFLLAALLHDVGKAIDLKAPIAAGVEALRGAVPERTLWLIEHLADLAALRDRTLSQRDRHTLDASEYFDDLKLLGDLDEAGRVPGAPVETLDQALAYLRGLEEEDYLQG